MPTIKDVAKAAGVSIATVSYVLNNRNDMVGEQTRHHVLETARKLGYRPNTTARNLQSSRTRLIGYAWHKDPIDQPTSVMDQFIYHLAQAAEALNYHLLTFTYPGDNAIAVYEDLIRSGRVDGFVLAETETQDARIQYLIKQGFPFVSWGRANPNWYFNWVDTDGKAGMRIATEYLLGLGHERIAFLGWPHDSLTGNFRLAGYLEAMHDAGCTTPEDYIIHNNYSSNSIGEALQRWQKLPARQQPTAMIAVSDFVAVVAMQTAEQFGFQIGKTLSLVGFDDAPFVRYLRPGLTTLRQPFRAIADLLVARLDGLIENAPNTSDSQKKMNNPQVIMNELIVPELIVRGSSGPPPTG